MSPGRHAIAVVCGVIAVSLCFGLLRVVDAAISGGLRQAPPATSVSRYAQRGAPDDRAAAGRDDPGGATDAMFVTVPPASVEAIDL